MLRASLPICAVFILCAFWVHAEDESPRTQIAREFCTLKTAQLESAIERLAPRVRELCPECTADVWRRFAYTYHPAFLNVLPAVALVDSKAPSPGVSRGATDLGSEKDWDQVSPQTDELRKRAFGKSECFPAVARFQKGEAELHFIAGLHESYATPEETREQRQLIEKELDTFKPGLVVVEGLPAELDCGSTVDFFLQKPSEIQDESTFLAHATLVRGTPWVGGEPGAAGVPAQDKQGIDLLYRLSVDRPGDSWKAFLKSLLMSGQYTDFPDLPSFEDWYRKKNGSELDISKVLEDFTPSYNLLSQGKRPRGTNLIMDEMDRARDRSVVMRVRAGLLTRKRVLVLYGRDHFPRQLPAYEAAFGKSSGPAAKCGGVSAPKSDKAVPGC